MWLVGKFVPEKSLSQPNHIWPPLPPSQFTFVRFPLSLPLAVAGLVTSCSLISHSWRRTWIFTTPPKPCWPIEIHPARFFSISFCSRKKPAKINLYWQIFCFLRRNIKSIAPDIQMFAICNFRAYSALFWRSLFVGSDCSVLPTYQSRTLTKAGTHPHSSLAQASQLYTAINCQASL